MQPTVKSLGSLLDWMTNMENVWHWHKNQAKAFENAEHTNQSNQSNAITSAVTQSTCKQSTSLSLSLTLALTRFSFSSKLLIRGALGWSERPKPEGDTLGGLISSDGQAWPATNSDRRCGNWMELKRVTASAPLGGPLAHAIRNCPSVALCCVPGFTEFYWGLTGTRRSHHCFCSPMTLHYARLGFYIKVKSRQLRSLFPVRFILVSFHILRFTKFCRGLTNHQQ